MFLCILCGACSTHAPVHKVRPVPLANNALVAKAKEHARAHDKAADLIQSYPAILEKHKFVERNLEQIRIRFSVGKEPSLRMGPGTHRTGGMIEVWIKPDGALIKIIPHEYRISIHDDFKERLPR